MNKQGEHGIAWTDYSWAVVNGCRRRSPGCEHCYAERLAATRLVTTPKYQGLAVFGQNGPRWTGEARLWPPELDAPLRVRKPSRIFVADMGDLFFERVTNEEICAVYGIMAACPQHTFQVLTKREDRMAEWYAWLERFARTARGGAGTSEHGVLLHYAQKFCEHAALRQTTSILAQPWPLPNVWLGVSVEDQKNADLRIPPLLSCPAAIRWLSVEPQLGAVDLRAYLRPELPGTGGARAAVGVDWVVQGGESGPGARPFDLGWARLLRNQCKAAGSAYFLKQLGANAFHSGLGVLDYYDPDAVDVCRFPTKDSHGGDPTEWPKDLRGCRAYPEAAR